jgi:hypothetical protein
MSDQSRRVLGAIFGLLMGLVYGLVSENINQLALPGVPLYNPGPGPAVTVLVVAMAGALLGLLAAWPDAASPGSILGALGGAIISTLASWYTLSTETADMTRAIGAYSVLFISFLPRAFLFAPVAWLMRRVVGVWESELADVRFSIGKMALSLGLLLALAVGAGWSSLYPKDARYALSRTNELIQSGRQVSSKSQLPEELKPVDGFVEGAHGRYTLLLGDDPDVLPIQRPVSSYTVQEYAVFVNFESGFRFGCAYTPPHPELACGEY